MTCECNLEKVSYNRMFVYSGMVINNITSRELLITYIAQCYMCATTEATRCIYKLHSKPVIIIIYYLVWLRETIYYRHLHYLTGQS